MANAATDTQRDDDFRVGDYQLTRCLGDGRVWSARHVRGGSGAAGPSVVIKLLPTVCPKLRRNLAAAAAIAVRSDHVCRILDFGVFEARGETFVVLEDLVGETLQERLRRDPQLPFALARDVAEQLARALVVVHAAGAVHGAIKPSNVFLCEGEGGRLRVKLLGLGQASVEPSVADASPERLVMGSPLYMSPELLVQGVADARSDLWSLACVFYRMIVGATPFGSGSLLTLYRRIADGELRPPSSVPGLPGGLDVWMSRALAHEPAERPASATAFLEALGRLSPPARVASSPPRPDTLAVHRMPRRRRRLEVETEFSPRTMAREWRRRVILALVTLVVGTLAGFLVGGVVLDDGWARQQVAASSGP